MTNCDEIRKDILGLTILIVALNIFSFAVVVKGIDSTNSRIESLECHK